MKKSFVTMLLAVVFLLPVFVGAENFDGKAGFTYKNLSGNVTKKDSSSNTYVNWKTSSVSSIRFWFALYDINGKKKGECLYGYLGTGYFQGRGEKNSKVHLAGHREHLGNSTTTVTGTWVP